MPDENEASFTLPTGLTWDKVREGVDLLMNAKSEEGLEENATWFVIELYKIFNSEA